MTNKAPKVIATIIMFPILIIIRIITFPIVIYRLIGQKTSTNSTEMSETTIEENKPGIESFKILTYNIFLRPPLAVTNLSDHKDSRTEDFSKLHLEKFDIVCLQELFSSYNYRQDVIINEAKKLGFKHFLEIPKSWFGRFETKPFLH
jgi:hypothetical protein